MGLATARLFMERGAYLVAEDINPKVMELLGADDTSVGFVSDVSEQAAIDVVALAVKRLGELDILVNNAASIVYKNAVEISLEEWNSILGITATGLFLHSREALKAMIPRSNKAVRL